MGWAALRALEPGSRLGGRPLAFAFGVICLAALLLATCEVVYIRDFYGEAISPRKILLEGTVPMPAEARPLAAALAHESPRKQK